MNKPSELLNELLPEMLELLKLFEALMSGAVPKKHESDAIAA
jgi:hypothetical protein